MLPSWDCQLKGRCTYYHNNPSAVGCAGSGECVSQTGQFGPFADGAKPAQCSARPLNVRGRELVLDVGSLSYAGGPNHPPAITTALECYWVRGRWRFGERSGEGCGGTHLLTAPLPTQACDAHSDCNAWTFCWKLEGCGSSCAKPPGPPPADGAAANRTLGQFGKCEPGGRYPFRTCTLKRVEDPASPLLWDEPEGGDWTSGTLLP